MTALIRLNEIIRTYGSPPVTALAGINLNIEEGEFVAIVGASGSGKSTLMNIIGTLDRPTSGSVSIAGVDTGRLSDSKLSALRSRRIGFVFQQFHLREGVTAVENVADGLLYTGTSRAERRRKAVEALNRVELGHRLTHMPHQLSGGERQRVAIARAVVGDPPLLLADEPTGNLDSRSGAGVVELLHSLHAAGTSILVITHDTHLAARLPRRVSISDGTVLSDTSSKASA
jgi:putative ABC transport system ATP-binding protein